MDTFFDDIVNMFSSKDNFKDKSEISVKPVIKPPEIKITRKVTVIWKKDGTKEVFENVADFSFVTYKLFYITFKDKDGDTVKKVYIPLKDVSRFDVEWIKT